MQKMGMQKNGNVEKWACIKMDMQNNAQLESGHVEKWTCRKKGHVEKLDL